MRAGYRFVRLGRWLHDAAEFRDDGAETHIVRLPTQQLVDRRDDVLSDVHERLRE